MSQSPAAPEILDLLTLTMVSGVGPLTCRALLERFQTPGGVLDASLAALRDVPGVGSKLAEKIHRRGRRSTAKPSSTSASAWASCRSLAASHSIPPR